MVACAACFSAAAATARVPAGDEPPPTHAGNRTAHRAGSTRRSVRGDQIEHIATRPFGAIDPQPRFLVYEHDLKTVACATEMDFLSPNRWIIDLQWLFCRTCRSEQAAALPARRRVNCRTRNRTRRYAAGQRRSHP